MNHLKTSTPKADNADQGGRILIVGLGNPGKKYVANRHNIGFMAVNRFADNHQLALNRTQNRSRVGSGRVADRAIVLAKPQTFMNRSGEAVAGLARFYKIAPVHILVVYDELDLPFGAIRLREKGGAGGHNGMRSVIQHIGEGFPRLRLGIGRPPGRMDPAAYVLQDFRGKELEVVSQILDAAAAAMESFIRDGIDLAMTWHNKK
ncbi:MAG: aminoacyl-tRNA hydrolase [Candidatus Promineifilaceae bacterium]|nr:aminoacyl-tRNA hydrolase [Candidatus Promineifilaceae bacterium]